jgi:tetratricopeptide (TPR) repeat protein
MSAQWAIQVDDLENAKALIAEADGLGSPDPTGHLILAAGYARSGRLPEIAQELRLAREMGFRDDPAELETALEHAGYGLYLQSRREIALYPEAERHLEKALELDPRLYGLELALYQVRIAAEDVQGARVALQSYQSHLPTGEPLFQIVEALLQETSGDPRAALDTLESLHARPDLNEERLSELKWFKCAGRLCLRIDDLSRAEEYLRRAVEIDPTDCGSWEALSVVQQQRMQAGDVRQIVRESAKDCADRAIACNPWLSNPYIVQAYVAHWEFGHEPDTTEASSSAAWKAARGALDALEGLPGGDTSESRVIESSLLVLEARAPHCARDYVRAAELFERALELDPENFRAASLLGNCAYRLEQPARGLEVIERALEAWNDATIERERDPRVLGALLAWGIGNAARLADAGAFERCRDRFALELGRGTVFEKEELLNTAEFLATAPVELRDCELAWTLLEEHGVRSAFESTPAAAEARETIRRIESACP